MTAADVSGTQMRAKSYNRFLLLVSGLGGLLFGVDVGIIAGALPYLEATSGFNQGQLSFIVAAVLLGSAISTLFAGLLADWLGRKPLMVISGLLFVASIPIIALSQDYGAIVLGRLLQGISGGLIGVVVPLYLAECLSAADRGKGTGIFQWLLTLGIMAAAVIGFYFSLRVDEVTKLGDAAATLAFKAIAWRRMFWVSLPPGVLFVLGSLVVSESPRWLYRRGRKAAAEAALLRSRSPAEAATELMEMETMSTSARIGSESSAADSLFRRKYVVPFLLACVILACNQATGVNSIIGYNTTILLQSGLSDLHAHEGYVGLTLVNFLVTIGGVVLVDRKGRKFLLSLGSAGIIVSLVAVGILFRRTEQQRIDCRQAVQAMVTSDQALTLQFNPATAESLVAATESTAIGHGAQSGTRKLPPQSLIIIYSYGDYRAATKVVRSDDVTAQPITITRGTALPPNRVIAFFSHPFARLEQGRTAPLKIENALVTPVPTERNGWITAGCIFAFMAFFAIGPGVCVWLALSELMPTRIRSNGMSIALLINQAVSTIIAGVFLPTVGQYGYAMMFFGFAACTVVYFVTAAFFLPETKGKTLEEIEAVFARRKSDVVEPST